jgi:hypothetical protein
MKQTLFGNSFLRNKWNWYGLGMPFNDLFGWGDWWYPNTGVKYLGFRIINAIADTTYGWVKLDFKEYLPGNFDTLYVLDFAYCEIPNEHLFAGQTSLTATLNIENNFSFHYYPNPTKDFINITNQSNFDLKIVLTEINGMILRSGQIAKQSNDIIDLSKLNPGLYIMYVLSHDENRTFKIIKQ